MPFGDIGSHINIFITTVRRCYRSPLLRSNHEKPCPFSIFPGSTTKKTPSLSGKPTTCVEFVRYNRSPNVNSASIPIPQSEFRTPHSVKRPQTAPSGPATTVVKTIFRLQMREINHLRNKLRPSRERSAEHCSASSFGIVDALTFQPRKNQLGEFTRVYPSLRESPVNFNPPKPAFCLPGSRASCISR